MVMNIIAAISPIVTPEIPFLKVSFVLTHLSNILLGKIPYLCLNAKPK